MAVFFYRTIKQPTEGVYKEKGSKFLSFAYPVDSEPDIKEKIGHLKKEYFDARHHCFAWILGPEKKQYRAFDDGEPNHSAGDPILGQIRSKELTNVLVVVVRYFGGVKLGVGGLIGAYKAAAEDALNKAAVEEREVCESFWLLYDYATTPEVMRLVKEFDLTILEQNFDESCKMKIEVAVKRKEKLTEKVALLQATGIAVRLLVKSQP